jgi:hypothetical protein
MTKIDSEINPNWEALLIFDKGAKNIGERQSLQQMVLENWIFIFRILQLDTCHLVPI